MTPISSLAVVIVCGGHSVPLHINIPSFTFFLFTFLLSALPPPPPPSPSGHLLSEAGPQPGPPGLAGAAQPRPSSPAHSAVFLCLHLPQSSHQPQTTVRPSLYDASQYVCWCVCVEEGEGEECVCVIVACVHVC